MSTAPTNHATNAEVDAAAAPVKAGRADEGKNTLRVPPLPTGAPDDYKHQHHGREALDRWLLHKTFLDDLAHE